MTQNVPIVIAQDANLILFAVVAGLLMAAAFHDLAFRTVPNWLSGVLLGLGLVKHTAQDGLPYSVGSVALIFILASFCWRRGLMGGGDVKLLSASASLVPVGGRLDFILFVAIAGGVLATIYLVLQRIISTPSRTQPSGIVGRVLKAERWRIARRGPLPYASAIAVGALCMISRG